jgi:hypothetical protein
MLWLKLAVVALALVLGIWMLVDGTRAFLVGDFFTPQSGEYAGQLGPWATLVSAVGLDPRSALLKAVHIGLGLFWLASMVAFLARPSWGRGRLRAAAFLSLWYLPFGTLIGVLVLVLLVLLPPSRSQPA